MEGELNEPNQPTNSIMSLHLAWQYIISTNVSCISRERKKLHGQVVRVTVSNVHAPWNIRYLDISLKFSNLQKDFDMVSSAPDEKQHTIWNVGKPWIMNQRIIVLVANTTNNTYNGSTKILFIYLPTHFQSPDRSFVDLCTTPATWAKWFVFFDQNPRREEDFMQSMSCL